VSDLHREHHFESEICAALAERGWLYEPGDAAQYDRARALFPADVIAWLREREPQAWEALARMHGAAGIESAVLDRLRKALDAAGTLDVLRHGFDVVGAREKLHMAQFRPASALNPELGAAYDANRLRVVRQVHYSRANENSLDLVLFLNGIPVATCELKSDFTQSVDDAVDQYRIDRPPQTKGRAPEPLLTFLSGALVHFAVGHHAVRMTTRLAGTETRFLPFDRGNDGGAGNAPNPSGYPTSYLWNEVFARDSWLEILQRFFMVQTVEDPQTKKKRKNLIFPRYHQLNAVRKLEAAARDDGPGGRYLIQHSAGSGKTNSIAWSAHFLADLHDAADRKLFDTVLVVSDRTVLDDQLQEAIFGFERTKGVVATITGDRGSKTSELAEALSGGSKIVVCTIQTFPHALNAVRDLAAAQGKRFAVIADEAHSSQTGESAAKLKAMLTPEEQRDLADGGEIEIADLMATDMQTRAAQGGITYVAFTATPKAKTLELFGRRPDLMQPASATNKPTAFHVYSMRQAIEEGFILDVLRNYTSYETAFRLAHRGAEIDEREIERGTAVKGIMQWVRLHPHNIAQKVRIVVEHFVANVAPLLGGTAKAMVVTASRVEAVRWKRAVDAYIAENGYAIGTLVAFSGEIVDDESGPNAVRETSSGLNPGLGRRDMRETFAEPEFRLLLVANKFQTGFDQPLLCGMYVDKRLAGISAVQTLSRLNRAHPDKDTTYVLDFVNDPDEILKEFKSYYKTAELSDVTDPDLILELRGKLDAAGYYDEFEIERVVAVELAPDRTQAKLVAALEPVASRLLRAHAAERARRRDALAAHDEATASAAKEALDALEQFRRDVGQYLKAYVFLAQIVDYGNTDFEKRFVFFKRLLPLLTFERERTTIDFSQVQLTHHVVKRRETAPLTLAGEGEKLAPMSAIGSGAMHEKEKARLAEIIEKVNELFEGDLTDGDGVMYVETAKAKMLESAALRQQALSNSPRRFNDSPDLARELQNALVDMTAAHSEMSRQALGSSFIQTQLLQLILGPGRLYDELREHGMPP